MTGLQSSTQSRSTKAWSSSLSGVTTPLPQRRTVSIRPTFHRGPFPLPLLLPPIRRLVTLPIKYTPYHPTINFCWHHGEPSPFELHHMRHVCNLITSCGKFFTPTYTKTPPHPRERIVGTLSTSHVESLHILLTDSNPPTPGENG